MLDFARRRPRNLQKVALREVIDRALTLVADKLRSQGVQGVKVLDESDPAAFGDRDELTQVFINLITNAADAMPKGGRLTLLTQVRRQSDIAYVSARVTDTGTGIPEEHREKIFESFFATKPEGKGTGLGLAVTLDILKNHKGTIEVDSELVVDRTRVEDERRPWGPAGEPVEQSGRRHHRARVLVEDGDGEVLGNQQVRAPDGERRVVGRAFRGQPGQRARGRGGDRIAQDRGGRQPRRQSSGGARRLRGSRGQGSRMAPPARVRHVDGQVELPPIAVRRGEGDRGGAGFSGRTGGVGHRTLHG
jgi:signal transduction histidine kinase